MGQPTVGVHSETDCIGMHREAVQDMSTASSLVTGAPSRLHSAVLGVPAKLTLDQQVHDGCVVPVMFQDELFLGLTTTPRVKS